MDNFLIHTKGSDMMTWGNEIEEKKKKNTYVKNDEYIWHDHDDDD